MNASLTSDTLTFTVFADIGSVGYVLLVVALLAYLATVLASGTVMILIFVDTSLHKPMYIFLFCLILNGLIGSTAVWPKIMDILSTNSPLISWKGCIAQVFFVLSYGVCNYSLLAVMAYDRFVSIFQPLQYHTIMTPLKVKQLMFVANLMPAAVMLGQTYIASRLPLCRFEVHKIFCASLAVVSLSCSGSQLSDLYGIINTILFVVLPVFLILLSYVKIIVLSLKASTNARKKVFETCSPHIITFVNFSLVSLFSLVYNRYNSFIPAEANIVLSVNYILFPPLLHPIIYGIKTQEIRQSFSKVIKRMLLH
ncbi:hypothetical protein ACEWY4_008161 [Coilia grayii]|uniref:Olfactory receptor n=1 Tax=Coilia grayii TaxID=363190 RepID=A0ABD1KA33_9TELE